MVRGHGAARWGSHEVWALWAAHPGPDHASAGTVLCVGPDALLLSGSFLGCPGDRRREGGAADQSSRCRLPPPLLTPGQHLRATVLEQREAGIPRGGAVVPLPSRRVLPPGLHSQPHRGCRSLSRSAQRSPWPRGSSRRHCAAGGGWGGRVLSTGAARAPGALGTEQSEAPGRARDTPPHSEVRVGIQGQTDGPFSDSGLGLSCGHASAGTQASRVA